MTTVSNNTIDGKVYYRKGRSTVGNVLAGMSENEISTRNREPLGNICESPDDEHGILTRGMSTSFGQCYFHELTMGSL